MQTPTVSDLGVVRKMDPYVSTQKLSYIKINPVSKCILTYIKEININLINN